MKYNRISTVIDTRNVWIIFLIAILLISCKGKAEKKNSNTKEKKEVQPERKIFAEASIEMNDTLSTIYSYYADQDDQNIYFYFQKKAEKKNSGLKTLDSLIISKKELVPNYDFTLSGEYVKNNQVLQDLPVIFEPVKYDPGPLHKKIIKAWYYDFDGGKIRPITLPDTAFRCYKGAEREPIDTSDATMPMRKPETFKLDGYWSTDCKETGYVSIGIEMVVSIANVNFLDLFSINTIVVKSETENNLYYLKFQSPPLRIIPFPEEMNWKNFSEDSTIAVIKLSGNNQATFSWLGFYNKKRKNGNSLPVKLIRK